MNKNKTKNDDKGSDFILRQYRPDAFSHRSQPPFIEERQGLWTRVFGGRSRLSAASVAGICIVLTASAAWVLLKPSTPPEQKTGSPAPAETTATVDKRHQRQTIQFDNASLAEIVEAIETTYGVKVTGLPENTEGISLTVSYEGDADEMTETINALLGTNLKIAE